MRPTSLWERNFGNYGNGELWEERIKSIHNVRNKVAHQKAITEQEYKVTNKKLNSINRELDKVVSNIQEQNYTEYEIIDILGSFALIADKIRKNFSWLSQSNVFGNIVLNISERMQEIIKPIEVDYEKIMSTMLKQLGNMASSSAMQSFNVEVIKKIASLEIAKEVKNITMDGLSSDEES